MGWLIVLSVIALICAILLVLDNHFNWQLTGVECISAMTLFLMLSVITAIVANICDVKSESEIVLTEYQNLQEVSTVCVIPSDALDYVLFNHFDYRGLIEKGLALEAPKDMYKTE